MNTCSRSSLVRMVATHCLALDALDLALSVAGTPHAWPHACCSVSVQYVIPHLYSYIYQVARKRSVAWP
jgi:hypothetical protein